MLDIEEYNEELIRRIKRLEDELDLRHMSVENAEGYVKALKDVERRIRDGFRRDGITI